MSGIRASPAGLKDEDDDYSFYLLVTDVERLKQRVGELSIREQIEQVVDDDLAAHVAAADPHPQYTTDSEVGTAVDDAMADHLAAGDPHPQYLTAAEGNAAYLQRANNLSDVALASSARSNLGLGDIATQSRTNVLISGGALNFAAIFPGTIRFRSSVTNHHYIDFYRSTDYSVRLCTVPGTPEYFRMGYCDPSQPTFTPLGASFQIRTTEAYMTSGSAAEQATVYAREGFAGFYIGQSGSQTEISVTTGDIALLASGEITIDTPTIECSGDLFCVGQVNWGSMQARDYGSTVLDPLGNPTITFGLTGVSVGAASGRTLGFYGSAGTTKPTISGSGFTALHNLLAALEGMGLIVDNTT